MTPEPLLNVEGSGGEGSSGEWQVRVVPNKFPAVMLAPKNEQQSEASILGVVPLPAEGSHEVIIESPRHVRYITELSTAELALVLQAYRERLRFWSADKRIEHVTIFKNVGVIAGASLEHLHSQLVALPGLSPVMAAELERSRRYYAKHQGLHFLSVAPKRNCRTASGWLSTPGRSLRFVRTRDVSLTKLGFCRASTPPISSN